MPLYVTDTHPLVWYVDRHAKLSNRARRVFNSAERGDTLIYIPAMVLLEAGILQRIGRFLPNEPFDAWVNRILAHPGFEVLPLEPGDISQAISFQNIKDPFDMCIVAAAKSKDLPLITGDQQIIDSRLVEILW